MKNTNRNLRDTVKYINSVAISKGIIRPLKCTYCPKIFRESQYLDSHVDRKHKDTQPSEHKLHQPVETLHHSQIDLEDTLANQLDGRYGNNIGTCSHTTQQQITANQTLAVRCERVNANLHDCPGNYENVNSSNHSTTVEKTKENERYFNEMGKVLEIERKCLTLNNNIKDIMDNFNKEKIEWNEERLICANKISELQKERIELENGYQTKFQDLEDRIAALQEHAVETNISPSTKLVPPQSKVEYNKIENITNKSPAEISSFQARLIADRLIKDNNNSPEENSDDKYDEQAFLSSITEVSAEYEDSVRDIKSLESDDDAFIPTSNYSKNNHHAVDTTNPPSTRKDLLENKKITKNKQFLEVQSNNKLENQDCKKKVAKEKENKTKHEDSCERKEEFSDDSDYKGASSVKNESVRSIRDLAIINPESSDSEDGNSTANSDNDLEEAIEKADNNTLERSVHLDDLLKQNPGMWKQLREATEEVVEGKLASIGIEPTARVSKSAYKQAIRKLRSARLVVTKKHENFRSLRKKIHHSLKSKVNHNTIDKESIAVPIKTTKRKSFSMLKSASKCIKSINKKPILPSKRGSIVAADTSIDDRTFFPPTTTIHQSIDDTDSDSLAQCKQTFEERVHIHHEPKRHMQRNLFDNNNSTPAEFTDKSQLIDKNKNDISIGIDNDAFSDQSICNTNDAPLDDAVQDALPDNIGRPPTRVGNLIQCSEDSDSSTASDVYHYASNLDYERAEYKPIKLKKPTGSKILKLKESIEAQLQQRQTVDKPAGAVDVMAQVHSFSATSSNSND